MSTAVSAGMQAALLIREKQRLRRKKFRRGRSELPTHVATKDIAPFPTYPPGSWVCMSNNMCQGNDYGKIILKAFVLLSVVCVEICFSE